MTSSNVLLRTLVALAVVALSSTGAGEAAAEQWWRTKEPSGASSPSHTLSLSLSSSETSPTVATSPAPVAFHLEAGLGLHQGSTFRGITNGETKDSGSGSLSAHVAFDLLPSRVVLGGILDGAVGPHRTETFIGARLGYWFPAPNLKLVLEWGAHTYGNIDVAPFLGRQEPVSDMTLMAGGARLEWAPQFRNGRLFSPTVSLLVRKDFGTQQASTTVYQWDFFSSHSETQSWDYFSNSETRSFQVGGLAVGVVAGLRFDFSGRP